ncbi:MAG: porin family protein [Candidatus Cloacimonetes bacterium]|jgi:hypothetical protein|nr:PorT family protein [Candidatus Cloacimonadota bacterium]MDD4223545.1 porin family protein [Candidatus Cloacimonadota bacterium]
MRKALIVLCLALLLAGAAEAKVKYGLRSGLNVSKLELSPDGSIDTRSALGLHIGGFVQLKTDSPLIIQPELLYTQKGTGANVDDVVTIDYIALPVLLKLNVEIPGAQEILIQPLIAPEMGYAINATSTYNPLFHESINKLNAGFNLGADLIYTGDYFIGLRYYLGMTDLLSDAKRPPISNTCWTISVGYLF